MLTRNLDLNRGMVNGAEVLLLSIHDFSITVQMASGQPAVLPRINFSIDPELSGLPFTLLRRQYPIIPAYALTVHRVQGQTLRFVGLFFRGDVFCHGMLYTALSRVKSWEAVRVWWDKHVEDSTSHSCCSLRNIVRSHVVRHLRRKI
jgi:ATP-dependent DNA helicase PIF1